MYEQHIKKSLPIIIAFCFPFLLYSFTLAPTFLWSDSSKLALQVQHRALYDFSHGYHPFHTVIGILFSYLPLELAVSQHLLSAFFASLSIVLLFLLLQELGYTRALAQLGALTLSVSHSFWLYAVITETYAMNACFFILQLLFALKYRNTHRMKYVALTFFCLGLSCYNHSVAILNVLPLIVLIFFQSPLNYRTLSLAMMGFVLGVSPLFLVPASKLGFSGLLENIFSDTGDHMTSYVQVGKVVTELWKLPFYIAYQFPSLAFFTGIIGIKKLWQKNFIFSFGLLLFVILNTSLALSYFLQRQFALLINSYIVFSIWATAGLEYIWENYAVKRSRKMIIVITTLVLPIVVYTTFPLAYKATGLNVVNMRELPYRDSIRYFFTPSKRKTFGAQRYAQEVFATVDEDAVILADFNAGMALKYYQEIHNVRQDVEVMLIIDDIYHTSKDPVKDLATLIDKYIDAPVYFADTYEPYYFTSKIEEIFELQRMGPLVKIEAK